MEAVDVEKLVLGFLGEKAVIENTEQFQTEKGLTKEMLEPVLKSLEAEEYL
jgi:hypothetical protein